MIRTSPQPARPQSGFTLMELMVVITLMGISLLVVAPRFEETVMAGGLNEMVRTMSALLQNQREQALASQKVKSLFIDFEQGLYGPGDAPLSLEELRDQERAGNKIPESVSVLDVEWPGGGLQTQGVAQFAVNEMGYVSHAAIHLEDQDRRLTLVLEPFLGKARIYEGYVSLVSE